jgi:hypothetical protein
VIASAALVGCAPLPPRIGEGCDHVAESAKRAGSDFVVDGDFYCATGDGDCELIPERIIAGHLPAHLAGRAIPIHILRKEADDYSKQLQQENSISFCYPPELWFPSEGHERGRYYLRREADQRYRFAFYPRERRH